MKTYPKPASFLALHEDMAELFGAIKRSYRVPDAFQLNLRTVDDVSMAALSDNKARAALTLRKLQALRLLTTSGTRTTVSVVVTLVSDVTGTLDALIEGLHHRQEVADVKILQDVREGLNRASVELTYTFADGGDGDAILE